MYSGYQLSVYKPIESFGISIVFLESFLISLYCEGFVFLGLVALSPDKAFAGFHFVVNESIIEVKFHNCKALFILFVEIKRFGCKKLETDVVAKQFLGLEKGMNFLKIVVPEIALSHKVNAANMVVR